MSRWPRQTCQTTTSEAMGSSPPCIARHHGSAINAETQRITSRGPGEDPGKSCRRSTGCHWPRGTGGASPDGRTADMCPGSWEAVNCGSRTEDKRGSDRSPHSRWNQQARLCGGRSPAETAKAVKRGRRQRREDSRVDDMSMRCPPTASASISVRPGAGGSGWVDRRRESRGGGELRGSVEAAELAVVDVVGEVQSADGGVAKSRAQSWLFCGHSFALPPRRGISRKLRASRNILWCCGWQLATCKTRKAKREISDKPQRNRRSPMTTLAKSKYRRRWRAAKPISTGSQSP